MPVSLFLDGGLDALSVFLPISIIVLSSLLLVIVVPIMRGIRNSKNGFVHAIYLICLFLLIMFGFIFSYMNITSVGEVMEGALFNLYVIEIVSFCLPLLMLYYAFREIQFISRR